MSVTPAQFSVISQRPITRVLGAASPLGCAHFILSQSWTKTPLIVVANDQEAKAVQAAIAYFDSSVRTVLLASLDTSPYTPVLPREQSATERAGGLAILHSCPNRVFVIATLASALELNPPVKEFISEIKYLKLSDSLSDQALGKFARLGYQFVDTVERPGEVAKRGSIVDIFSPSEQLPLRVDRFGDDIESMRLFDPESQRTIDTTVSYSVSPAHTVLYSDQVKQLLLTALSASNDPKASIEIQHFQHAVHRESYFPGLCHLLPHAYKTLVNLGHYLNDRPVVLLNPIGIEAEESSFLKALEVERKSCELEVLRYPVASLYSSSSAAFNSAKQIHLPSVAFNDEEIHFEYPIVVLRDIRQRFSQVRVGTDTWLEQFKELLSGWIDENYRVFLVSRNQSTLDRLQLALSQTGLNNRSSMISLLIGKLPESIRIKADKSIHICADEILGKVTATAKASDANRFQKEADRLSFGDLKSGDLVVHAEHGVGCYDGLKIIEISGVTNEFLQLSYRDADKLYLPVYRLNLIRRFSGPNENRSLDKLGTSSWYKVKSRVKNHLKDLTSELLKLYAERERSTRPPLDGRDDDFMEFEKAFPYVETYDQAATIDQILVDLKKSKPMDRLICGDVGFGKTEIAMRAAFKFVQARKQVAVIAPTTILAFQHYESFKKRFKNWPIEIRVINRFVNPKEQRDILEKLKLGEIDIVIGTHRLLSKDIEFKNLGLLVIDEEQKFGVAHKERVRSLKVNIDTLAMSATPIPRTLNLSLVGVRDLSLITTPPVDRLPIKTLICKFEKQTIRNAILFEIGRGGQVYFIHNRIQSIYVLHEELKQIVPEARIKVGHGQMPEHELEKTMLDFFNHQIDVLLCTTIVESGMDVSRANTIIIDKAHTYGLSQLYQLRGRVGRSPEKAFCFLLVPNRTELDKDAQQRLQVLQDNTELGSGIRIAHYDLELRGSGDILGHDQSGHINSIGYETYMELLKQTIAEAQGSIPSDIDIEPEINLRIPAYLPDKYIPDIRNRLYYYKLLNDLQDPTEIDSLESELVDQYGPLPVEVLNLMGVMLIKNLCRQLKVKELSSGPAALLLRLSDSTPIQPQKIIHLAMVQPKKYSLTPDSRLRIKIEDTLNWTVVHSELSSLTSI